MLFTSVASGQYAFLTHQFAQRARDKFQTIG
jgi:hypothetical protein